MPSSRIQGQDDAGTWMMNACLNPTKTATARKQGAADQSAKKYDLVTIQCDLVGNDPVQAKQQQSAKIFYKCPSIQMLRTTHTRRLLSFCFFLYYHTVSGKIDKANVLYF